MTLDLALIQFKGETKAASEFGTMRAKVGSHEPWTHEVAIVERHHNGRMSIRGTFAQHYVDVEETDHVSQPGAAEGALTGAVVGLLLGPPGLAAGFVLGGTIGAEAGRPTEVEAAPDTLVRELRDVVPKGYSAVVLLAAPSHVDAMLSAFGETKEAVVRRTLTDAEASALLESVGGDPLASPGPSQAGDDTAPPG